MHVLSSREGVLRDEMSSPEAMHGLLFMKRGTASLFFVASLYTRLSVRDLGARKERFGNEMTSVCE